MSLFAKLLPTEVLRLQAHHAPYPPGVPAWPQSLPATFSASARPQEYTLSGSAT